MNTARIGVMALAISALACGGGGTPPGSSTENLESSREQQTHAQGRHTEGSASSTAAGPQMPTEIRQFHDTLAPRWHAPQGPQRIADTCGEIGRLNEQATAIVDAAPPTGTDPQAWTDTGKQLDLAIGELAAACRTHDAAGFETAFEHVHTSFHKVMEAGGIGDAEHAHEAHDDAEHAPDK